MVVRGVEFGMDSCAIGTIQSSDLAARTVAKMRFILPVTTNQYLES